MFVTDSTIRKTVIAICNSFASEAFAISDLMSLEEQVMQLGRLFSDSYSKLHGILMLIDDRYDPELYKFIALYIRRLKKVLTEMLARSKQLARAEGEADKADEFDYLGR